MDRLVRILILSACILHNCIGQDKVKRSIFSWSKEAEVKDLPVVPGYLPPLTVHKYHGVQINPADGPSVYLPGSDLPLSNEAVSVNQFQSAQLSPEYSSQLDLLKNVVTFLPDDGRLQDYDVTALLPYADLISEDALARIQFVVESEKSQKESKLLKLIGFLRHLKELKLKPFKAAANFGASLLSKKKQAVSNLLHLGSPVTPAPPVLHPPTYPHPGYPIHHPAVRPPYFVPIQSPPLSDEGQLQQQLDQQQQQPAAPSSVANSDNRVGPSSGHQVPSYPQITPAGTFLTNPQYPVVPRNEFGEPPAYFSYPKQFQPSSYQPRYQFAGNTESTPAPHQQPAKRTNTYLEDPYKSSNVPTYQATEQPAFHYHHFAGQEKSKYSSTPADGDLAGSASDNVEKIGENSGSAVDMEIPLVRKKEQHSESSSQPTTRLTKIETRQPVIVYPEIPAISKPADSESSSLPQPLATVSPAHQSSK